MKKSSGLGGSVVSKNILQNKGNVKWYIKEKSVNFIDNGWKFLSEIETDEYLADASNMSINDWRTIIE
ncbi:immunity protein Imm33 domain-containing protein [Bacillus paramycoides]|uniref:immunity protein Imm33 domain-containing protein n=1 Tax=Bacillus paramycoides TaxID=2026194 RepID=UPI003D0181D9